MAAQQKKIGIGGTIPGTHCKYVELTVTCSTVGTLPFSAFTAFGETYAAAPIVLGANTVTDPDAIVSAAPTTTGVTLFVTSSTRTNLPDGPVLASALLYGALG
jgi:hypothetical protein